MNSRVAGRADLHPHAALALVAAELAVRRAGRHLHRVAGAEQVLAAVEHEPQRALDHLEALGLARVDVVPRDEAAAAADGVELEQLRIGVPDLEAEAQAGGVEDVHAGPCAAGALPDHPGGVSGFGARRATAASINCASRRWRVSGFFALVTQ